LKLLTEPLVRGLPLEAAVWPSVVVEPFPFLEEGVELSHRGNQDAVEPPVAFLVVDSMGSLGLPVQVRAAV
jgi:hypothetical protein